MESRITQVRIILNNLVDANGGSPFHSGKGRFWNQPRDEFVAGPIYGKIPIVPGDPNNSFLVQILQQNSDNFSRMPPSGPYISDDDLAFIKEWIGDGAPDLDEEFRSMFKPQTS